VSDETGVLAAAAVRHAAAFPSDSASQLTGRLYRYNRIPVTPRLRHAFPNAGAVESFLLHGSRGLGEWERHPVSEGYECWMMLRRPRGRGRPTHKLYVAVEVDAVREALHETLAAADEVGATTVKVAITAEALARADKLLVYASSKEELEALVAALAPRVRGLAAHAVPFTAATGTGAPLSWGMDPPTTLTSRLGSSWRILICRQLGETLAATQGAEAERADAAFAHVARLGIDTATWVPRDDVWTRMEALAA
jgi:hypothetical protein